MPELPEVETVLRGLKARVVGRTVAEVEVRNPLIVRGPAEEFAREILARRIEGVKRKGKALSLSLDGPPAAGSGQAGNPPPGSGPQGGSTPGAPERFLLLRLGMTGQVTVNAAEEPLPPHTHLRLKLDDGREELRFRDPRRFGSARVLSAPELRAVFGALGPDAQEATAEEFLAGLRGRRGAIKSLLMNQQFVSGLGNIYADEALFVARIHPLKQAGRLRAESARRLWRAVRRVLDRAIRMQGTSFRDYIDIEGRPGNFLPRLRVYAREGEPCRICKTPIRRIVIAGRSSHFCPACQRRPRRVAGIRRLRRRSMRSR